MPAHLEIERKFLIEAPDPVWLAAWPGSSRAEIVQTYLTTADGSEARVRRWRDETGTRLFHTVKRTVSALTREETEREISGEEYRALLKQADPARHPLSKTRWRLPWKGLVLEIDLYPFLAPQALLEVELPREDTQPELPPPLRIIREVTGDPAWKNAALAAL